MARHLLHLGYVVYPDLGAVAYRRIGKEWKKPVIVSRPLVIPSTQVVELMVSR